MTLQQFVARTLNFKFKKWKLKKLSKQTPIKSGNARLYFLDLLLVY